MKITTSDEAMALIGQRVRYIREGTGHSARVDSAQNPIDVPFRVEIEGEVRAWEAYGGGGLHEVKLMLAGYGEVEADFCTLATEPIVLYRNYDVYQHGVYRARVTASSHAEIVDRVTNSHFLRATMDLTQPWTYRPTDDPLLNHREIKVGGTP